MFSLKDDIYLFLLIFCEIHYSHKYMCKSNLTGKNDFFIKLLPKIVGWELS